MTGYIQGLQRLRQHNTNPASPDYNPTFGYQDNDFSPLWLTHFDPRDPRLVVIFLTTPESFTGSGQNTYPITAAGHWRIQTSRASVPCRAVASR